MGFAYEDNLHYQYSEAEQKNENPTYTNSMAMRLFVNRANSILSS